MPGFAECIVIVSLLSALIPVFVGRRTGSLLWWYCIISLLADTIGFTLMKMHIQKGWVSNVFLLLEWLLIATCLAETILPKKYRTAKYLSIGLVGGLFCVRTVQKSFNIPNYGDAAILYVLYTLLTLATLYKVIKEIEYLQIERSPTFIFSAAFLLYVSGSLIMLLSNKHLRESNPALLREIWVVHNILNVLKNCAIAYCLLLIKRQRIG